MTGSGSWARRDEVGSAGPSPLAPTKPTCVTSGLELRRQGCAETETNGIGRGRSIVVQSKSLPVGTYTFVLQPVDDISTRFLVRDRAAWKGMEWLFKVLVYEPLHAYMETGLLQGVRQRAQGRPSTHA
jgi:hypothetical protein